jgi:hypothetical protein
MPENRPAYEELMEKFVEICDSLVSTAFVVTDGIRVSAIVLDEKVALFLAREMIKKYNDRHWTYLQIPDALEYAFSRGVEYQKQMMIDAVKPNDGDKNEENTELREGDIQPQQEPS